MTTGRIVRIAWRPFAVPFRAPLQTSSGIWLSREGLLVAVTAEDGAVALGEASPLSSGPGLPAVEAALRQAATASIGRAPAEAWSNATSSRACGPAAFGLEVPVATLAALDRGLPLFRCLAKDGRAPSPGNVPVNALVDVTSAADASERARAATTAGYRTLKLKVGGAVADDIVRIQTVRDATGPDVELRIDANGGWDTSTAAEVLVAAAKSGVALCEQPVPPGPDAPAAFAALRILGVPLAADESCRSEASIQPFLDAGAIDAVVIKPMLTGLSEALAMIELARATGLATIVTTTFDAGAGTLAAMHLAASMPPPLEACGLATLELLDHPLVAGIPPVIRGEINLSGEPGMAMTLDEPALERYATGPWVEVTA